jgi:hypothetical protein
MHCRKAVRIVLCAPVILALDGCGTYVPQLEEFWEPISVTSPMEFRIKQKIFC